MPRPLHEDTVRLIRRYHRGGYSASSIARALGLSRKCVSNIVNGRTHVGVVDDPNLPPLRKVKLNRTPINPDGLTDAEVGKLASAKRLADRTPVEIERRVQAFRRLMDRRQGRRPQVIDSTYGEVDGDVDGLAAKPHPFTVHLLKHVEDGRAVAVCGEVADTPTMPKEWVGDAQTMWTCGEMVESGDTRFTACPPCLDHAKSLAPKKKKRTGLRGF